MDSLRAPRSITLGADPVKRARCLTCSVLTNGVLHIGTWKGATCERCGLAAIRKNRAAWWGVDTW